MAVGYPKTMREALPDKGQVAEVRARLDEAGVKYIFSCWIDLLGIPKTKPVPLSELEALCRGKGPQFAVHSVSMVPELGPADSDQIPIPDLDSVMLCPWDRTCAWMFADLWWEGEPYNICPRQALKRQVKAAADAGYAIYAGIEPEFTAMRYDGNGRPVKAIDDDPALGTGLRPRRQAFGYDAEASIDSMHFLGNLIDILTELDWGIKDVVAEGAYSQFELDFGYTDVLRMADRLVFLRILVKEVAKKHGIFVTFMPKPTQGDWRNGAHINLSVQGIGRPGVNLFEANDESWMPIAHHVVGGILEHAAALTAVACPTVNSYKGLIARARGFEGGTVTWAPTHIAYGKNNRSAMLRLPQSRFAIENRAADMCMNPYLSLAMTTALSIKGITQRVDPGQPIDRALYDLSEAELEQAGVKPLPTNLLEAIRAFDEDPVAAEVFGPTMHRSYSRYKHDEWTRFHEAITDWETKEYLRFF